MGILDRLFLKIGAEFTLGAYMASTKGQGLLWSAADVTLALVFLKIADEARLRYGKGRIHFRFRLVWISAFLSPFLLLAKNPGEFFLLESLIFGIQYLVLLFSAFTESRGILKAIRENAESTNV